MLTHLLILFFVLSPIGLFAQSRVEGIIYDEESKDRLGQVQIYNLQTHQRLFNNAKGEFRLDVNPTDSLVFMKEGYFTDTIQAADRSILVLSMLRDFRYIKPVQINPRRSPVEILEQSKRENRDAYTLADPGSLIGVGLTGAGLNLNALYNLWSKEGRNARRFTAYMQTLYEENTIDSVFTPDLVRNLVGLEGDRLQNFLIRYRPTYAFVTRASHYQLTQYIKSKYNMFKILPDLRPLPELPQVEFELNKNSNL